MIYWLQIKINTKHTIKPWHNKYPNWLQGKIIIYWPIPTWHAILITMPRKHAKLVTIYWHIPTDRAILIAMPTKHAKLDGIRSHIKRVGFCHNHVTSILVQNMRHNSWSNKLMPYPKVGKLV